MMVTCLLIVFFDLCLMLIWFGFVCFDCGCICLILLLCFVTWVLVLLPASLFVWGLFVIVWLICGLNFVNGGFAIVICYCFTCFLVLGFNLVILFVCWLCFVLVMIVLGVWFYVGFVWYTGLLISDLLLWCWVFASIFACWLWLICTYWLLVFWWLVVTCLF